jgi:putative transposase
MPSKALPMAPTAFEQWCRARALAPSTRDYLSTIRGSEPVRRVTSRGNSVSGMYPSRKMGVTIQFESQNPELWAIVVMDHDPEVVEFFEQPDTWKLRYLDKAGKKTLGHYYTPDFLVLRKDSVCFEEWKREDELKLQAVRAPFRYQQQEDGSWRCPPAEEAASALGLTFRVRSSAELHATYVDNLLFLEDYFGAALTVPEQVQTTIFQRVRETPGLPLSALEAPGSGVRANDIYAMLALDLIYVDLYAAPLIQHGRVRLYLNAEQARVHAHLLPTRLASWESLARRERASHHQYHPPVGWTCFYPY